MKPEVGNNKSLESISTIRQLMAHIASTLDGLILCSLMLLYISAGAASLLANDVRIHVCGGISLNDISLSLFIMPIALLSEFVWFGIGLRNVNKFGVRSVVLMATASIPFFRACLG